VPGRCYFLLIGKKTETEWTEVLQRALFSLGELHVVSEEEAVQAVTKRYYDSIIIDAGAVPDASQLVYHIQSRRPEVRLVVATASPTWQQAREMLQAGAADYIFKSQDENELRSEIQAVLKTPPPSWAR